MQKNGRRMKTKKMTVPFMEKGELPLQQKAVEHDLARSITVDEVITKVREGLTGLFKRGHRR